MKILETKRLIIRHYIPEDLDTLFDIFCDPKVKTYLPDAPTTYEKAREELEWFQNGHPKNPKLGLWGTIHKDTGQFIGSCGLLPLTIDGKPEIELSYMLARFYWGQGLGTEAAKAVLSYGFEQLGLQRVICLVDPENLRSVNVAKNIGMTFEREGEDEHGPYHLYAKDRQKNKISRMKGG
jgi:RimJ/RimL family protein N-acetyltransferase